MALSVKRFVVETLRDGRIRSINFRYGSILVYPEGFSRDVAKLVEDGHIQFTNTPGAHYTVDARPGERHTMALPSQDVEPDPRTGALNVRGSPGSLFRGTIVHEATHALQDYQRHPSDPRTAEGAAYLAGWMANLLWGYPPLPAAVRPTTGHAYARRLAERRLQSQIGYVIPEAEVRALNDLVLTGSASRYVFNGI
jgi:hypothetical protein